MATSTSEQKVGVDEAERIAKEYVAKRFNMNDPQVFAIAFSPSYGTFTVSVIRKEKHHEVHAGEHETQGDSHDKPAELDKTEKRTQGVPQVGGSYDVTVDKTGSVVGWVRIIRTSKDAEVVAREYAVKRHGLTHFRPYTTTFDGTYFTVYGGGLVYEGGIVRSALKVYKSKFYDVKIDRSGIVVGWTTEGLVTHYSAKIQRLR